MFVHLLHVVTHWDGGGAPGVPGWAAAHLLSLTSADTGHEAVVRGFLNETQYFRLRLFYEI